MSAQKVIFCEDKYGRGFFKELLNELKSQRLISTHLAMNVEKFYGPCNPKLERQLKLNAFQKNCDFFIVVVDADGRSLEEVREEVAQHVPRDLKEITCLVILDYEIEDWLCFSLGIRVFEKPSRILRHKLGYEKYRLKSYVSKLDMPKLLNCSSFGDFVNCLRSAP